MEINNYNPAFLPDDDETDCCQTCYGRGGRVSSQDPVGDGIGSESFLDPCPDCIGSHKCPHCMGPLLDDNIEGYICERACGWTPERIDEPDYESDWGDYGDDGF